MRVALLTQNARAGDAVGRQVAEKAAYFQDHGADVAVVLADLNRLQPSLRPLAVRQRPETTGPGWQTLEQSDLVCVEYSQYYPLLDLLPLLADGRRKILLDYHGITPPEFAFGRLRDDLLRGQESRGLAALADGVIVHSAYTQSELSSEVPLDPARLHHLGCVVDAHFVPDRPRHSLKARLGIGEARLLLFVGRLAANKRLPTLIAALHHLRDTSPAVHAAVIGPSGDVYEAERLRCRELATDLGVADRLHFLGEVDESALCDAYRGADALVMPSVHEGFCLPVAEAMACGVPVVAARAAALPETLGHAGLTFTPDNPADLARQVSRLFAASPPAPGRRIAVVIGPGRGGAERSLATIAECLTGAGRDVEIMSADDPELMNHEGEFAAVVVGPVGAAHSRGVVRRFGRRCALLPCLHDEPVARTTNTREMFGEVGGVLFHSDAERDLAARFGLSLPNQQVVGAWIDTSLASDPRRGRRLVGHDRYFVYCGRRLAEKGLPQLFDHARRFDQEQPGAVRFAFVGEGALAIPDETWAVDLGRLGESDKRDVLAGARALINLSSNESLSLVALEALALGTPVIVAAGNAVTSAHAAAGGGRVVANFTEFAAAVNQFLVSRPAKTADYVRREYGSREVLAERVLAVIGRLDVPLAETAARAGVERAGQWTRPNWRARFERIVEQTLHSPPIPSLSDVAVSTTEPVVEGLSWSIDLHVRAGRPLVPTGPGRTEIVARWRASDGEIIGNTWAVALTEMVLPGETKRVAVPLPAPPADHISLEAGVRVYRIGRVDDVWSGTLAELRPDRPRIAPATPRRRSVTAALARARAVQALPDDYVDPPSGRLGRVKQWVKAKLLNNFRVGYVDVLSRQQTRYNRRLLDAVQELAATTPADDGVLRAELADLRRQYDELTRRLAQLESASLPRVRQEAA